MKKLLCPPPEKILATGLHRVCLENDIDPDYKLILDDFENNFNHLYENI